MKDEFTTKEIQKYAWDYFQLHASQRMTTFNFFIILSALLTTGLVTTFQPSFNAHLLGGFLGILMVLISFIFWKMDQRIKYFLKNAENALKYIELSFPLSSEASQPHPIQIFSYEEVSTKLIRVERTRYFWNRHLSYAQSFNLIFAVFALFGFIGFIASIVLTVR